MDKILNSDCIFIITKEVLDDYFSSDMEVSYNMEFLIDFIKFISSESFLIGNLYNDMREQVGENSSAFQYIDAIFKDGKEVVGSSTFGSEAKDTIFLAGSLCLFKSKHIVIITKGDDLLSSIEGDDLKSVFEKLDKHGLDIEKLKINIVSAVTVVKWIKMFHKEFMEHKKSLSQSLSH